MSSAGQVAGYVIGGVVGAAFPAVGWVIGAQIGGMIGGYIDPPKGANSVGPRLEDLTVQTSTYGAVLPRIKGTVAVTGNVFWLEGDKIKEHEKTEKVGGKGGPTSKQTTFSYSATFAVGLSHQISAPIGGVRRLWLANTLVYDAGSGDLASIIASNLRTGVMFKFYDGRDDQEPDPRMQADKGINNVSGYPGRCYIVFYDLDLTEKYNNTLMATQVKVELVCGTAGSPAHTAIFTTPDVDSEREIVSAVVAQGVVKYAVARVRSWDGQFDGVDYYESRFGEYLKKTASVDHLISVTYYRTGVGTLFVSHNRDGGINVIAQQGDLFNLKTQLTFISGGTIVESEWLTSAQFTYGHYNIAACDEGSAFLADSGAALPILRFDGAVLGSKSSVSVLANCIALSENRVFVLNYTGSTSSTTVTVLNRTDLSLVSNYTQAVNGYHGVLHVVSDTEFYLVAGDYLSHWVDGVAENLGAVCHSPTGSYPFRWAAIYNDPDYFVQFDPSSGSDYELSGFITNFPISAQVAKLRDVVTEECALAGISSADIDLTELINSDVRGYRASSAGSVRTVLEQLQAAFPFDVVQSGYKLKFKSRGGASVVTVPEADLGAHTGDEVPSRFMLTTEMPSQVPAKVTFNFLNADREYDPDEQAAMFTAKDVKNSYTVSLPLVMTPTEALRAADVLLRKEQTERTTAGTFWLPPTDDYRKLEAADVIDVIAQGRTHTLRLIKVTQLPDGRIECDGKITASASYASTALSQSSLALGQSGVPLAGSSELLLLDIPRIVSDQDTPGIVLGMYGYTSGWPGGIALRSDDSGQSYAAATAFQTKTEVFTAVDAIGTGSPYAIDHVSTLTVTPDFSGADLFSITEAQLYTHGNLAAYGADGNWEIVAFKTAVDNTGSYTLRDFRRGLCGTEHYSGTHATGDKLVMLDLDAADFVGLPLTAINSPRLWRGVTAGASVDSVSDIVNTYGAVNLKPLAPVHLKGDRDTATRNWKIRFSPRTRWPVELFSGLSVPLGETSPMYEVEVWNSTYTVLKRTISGLTTNEADYTAAQQIVDFGSEQDTLYLKVYQLSSFVGRGFPLVASIYRNVSEDPYIGSVKLLMHMDDTGLTDQCGHAVTLYGGAARSSTQSRYGGYSAYIDGAGDYLTMADSADWVLGSSDWTLEVSFYEETSGVIRQIIGQHSTHSNSASSFIVLSNSQKVELSVFVGGAITTIASASTHTLNSWHDLSAERHGNTIYLYLDGLLVASSATLGSSALNDSNQPLTIGVVMKNGSPDPGGYYFKGFLDETRFTPGISRRGGAGSYTVPSAAFPNP